MAKTCADIFTNFYYPIILVVGVMSPSGFWKDVSPIHQLIITAIIGIFIGIVMSVYVVTNGFKKPIDLLLDSFRKVGAGDYTSRTPVVTNDEIGILIDNFNGMVEGLAERELIRKTFGKYVTKSVAEEILGKK